MAKLKNKFTRKQWKDCCGKGCKKCEIAQAYTAKYGRSDGLTKLNADRDTMKAKSAKKAGKKGGGSKSAKAKKKVKA